jgi:hypothetical protein
MGVCSATPRRPVIGEIAVSRVWQTLMALEAESAAIRREQNTWPWPWRRMNGRYMAQRPLQTLTPPLLYYYTLLTEVSEHQYLSEQQSPANERYEWSTSRAMSSLALLQNCSYFMLLTPFLFKDLGLEWCIYWCRSIGSRSMGSSV